jgi:type 1 glutamine amidotransferase
MDENETWAREQLAAMLERVMRWAATDMEERAQQMAESAERIRVWLGSE